MLHSLSRLSSALATPAQKEAARKTREAMAAYEQSRDLIELGAYVAGSNSRLDAAIRAQPQLQAFLRQDATTPTPVDETHRRLTALAEQLG